MISIIKNIVRTSFVLAAFFALINLSHAQAPTPVAVSSLPKVAPSWSLKDLEGNLVSSDQFKGKVVVIDFWATWCGPCRQEIPGYVELQKKYAADGLVIIGVSLDQAGASVVIDAIPSTFIIDRDGLIRDQKVGSVRTADFEKRILKVLMPGKAQG